MHEILDVRVWALESFYLERAKSAILRRLEAGRDLADLEIPNPERSRESKDVYAGMEYDEDLEAYVHSNIDNKTIAHIPVLGSLTKRGGMCTRGSKHHINRIQKANDNPNIDAIVIEIDGPGGSVDGTEEFGMAVKNSVKPIVVFVDGMAASAHYWVASQAQHIVANSAITSWIGSIGTLVVHVNQQEWLAKNGMQVEIIRAPQSIDKARENSFEPLTEDAKARLLKELEEITDHFISTVKSGRGARLNTGDENIFTGKVYNGRDALAMGMIDEIGGLQAALNKAAELATINTMSFINSQNKLSSMKILSFLGLGKEVESKLTPEQKEMLESADTKLAELEASVAEKESRITTLQSEKDAAEIRVSELEASITEKDLRIETLEKKPDGTEAKASKAGDENGGATEEPREKNSWEVKAERKTKSLKS
jgi:signal peptide peptidase SppA